MRVLPLPPHFDPDRVGEVWPVAYEDRAREAREWAANHDLIGAAEDGFRLCLLVVDVQNTFCIPGFELFVGGRSGRGAVDDNRRLKGLISIGDLNAYDASNQEQTIYLLQEYIQGHV